MSVAVCLSLSWMSPSRCCGPVGPEYRRRGERVDSGGLTISRCQVSGGVAAGGIRTLRRDRAVQPLRHLHQQARKLPAGLMNGILHVRLNTGASEVGHDLLAGLVRKQTWCAGVDHV